MNYLGTAIPKPSPWASVAIWLGVITFLGLSWAAIFLPLILLGEGK